MDILTNPFWKKFFESMFQQNHIQKFVLKKFYRQIFSILQLYIDWSDFPFYVKWKQYGVQYLCHLIDIQNKNFYTFQQIKQKINTNNFVKYYSLISDVPECFKDHVKENIANVSLISFNHFDNFFSKDCYKYKSEVYIQ